MKRRLELYSRCVEPDMPEAVGKISLRTNRNIEKTRKSNALRGLLRLFRLLDL